MRALSKRYGSITALDHANLTVHPGEVHALLGENGAGKSTLVHVLGGLVQPDAGTVEVWGRPVRLTSPFAAAGHSIGLVHQHFKLVPALTVLENIALGVIRTGWRLPLDAVRARAREVSTRAGLNVELDALVGRLGVGAKQRVEVLKLLYADPDILILDEPTAVLPPAEVAALFRMIRGLADRGKTVLLIAHKLDEVLSVADRVTVLRGGRTMLESPRGDVDAEVLTRAMVGDAPVDVPTRSSSDQGEVVAVLDGVAWDGGPGIGALDHVDLSIRRGEIVGVAGVDGNGQRALSLTLTGRAVPDRGLVRLPEHIGFVPQDRGHEGLAAQLSLVENTALAAHRDPAFRRGPLLDWDAVARRTTEIVNRFDVRASGVDVAASTLSGGNQQKLVVGREITGGADLLVVENPTRGLDVAAAATVHRLLLELRASAERAPGIVLVSTDLDEVLALSDRVFAAVRGALVPVVGDSRDGSPPSREAVGAAMLAGA